MIKRGQATLEFTFVAFTIVVLSYGMIRIFAWAGKDLAERRWAQDQAIINPSGNPEDQLRPDFYRPKRMNSVMRTWDFGDYSSSYMTSRAWEALNQNNVAIVDSYVNEILLLYGDQAQQMQASYGGTCPSVDWANNNQTTVASKWALNDVGTALYIQGQAYQRTGNNAAAIASYQQLINNYSCAFAYDPSFGGYWSPAAEARNRLTELGVT